MIELKNKDVMESVCYILAVQEIKGDVLLVFMHLQLAVRFARSR